MSTDGDMWNLDRAHFHTRSPKHSVQLFYANAYSAQRAPVMYPICYIGTTSQRWQEIMQPILSLVDDADQQIQNSILRSNKDERSRLLTIDERKREFDLRSLLLQLVAYGAKKHGRQWTDAGKAVSPQWYFDQLLFGDAIRLVLFCVIFRLLKKT